MFQIDDDMTIYITRGDVAFFTVTAENNGEKHKFQPGDVVRIKVYAKKDATNVAFQKDFPVLEESEKVDILLTEAETKIGDVISKPVDYWYEIELNPYTNPQTIIGYDDDGAKIFKLFPEGRDLGPDVVPEDVPVVDSELSLTSRKPIENQAVTRAMIKLSEDVKNEVENHAETLAKMEAEVDEALNKAYTETDRVSHELAIERARINNLVANAGDTDNNAELIDIRTGADGTIYETAGEAVRGQVANLTNTTEFLKDVDGILKCATGLEEKKDVKLSFLGLYSGKTRAKTDFFGTTYATHISIAEVAGYQTSVFYYTGDNYVSSPWNTKIDRLDISGCDKAYVAYRKSDDSALTDADANNIQSAMKAFLFYDGGLKSDLSELETSFAEELEMLATTEIGFNKLNPNKIITGKSFVNAEWYDTADYDTSNLIEIPVGYTLIHAVYPNNDGTNCRLNNGNNRSIAILNSDGSLYEGVNGIYYYTNTATETKYARITMLSESNSSYTGMSMVWVIKITSSKPQYYDARAYEPYYETKKLLDTVLTSEQMAHDFIKKSVTTKSSDLAFGYLSNGEPQHIISRFYTMPYYKVSKGDVVLINNDNVSMGLTEYDEDKNYICAYGYRRKNYTAPGDVAWGYHVVQNSGYIRAHFATIDDSAINLSKLGGVITILNFYDNRNNSFALDKYLGKNMLYSHKAKVMSIELNGQDGTFIDGKLWSFADGLANLGSIKVIDLDTGNATEKTHQLGHANGVDYNSNNDTLITYGSNGDNKPTIVLYKNPSEADSLLLTDANCTVIPLYGESDFLNPSASLCWGEADCFIYYITGVYADAENTVAPTREIYKIMLGMGENDLSAGGFGTFTSGKAETEYNGTCKLVKTFTGEIADGFDTWYGRNNLPTPQGMTFDKYIYIGYGTSGHNFLKIALDDDTNTYKVVDNYMYKHYSYDGTEKFYEPEMLAIKDGKMYCGSVSISNGKLFVVIDM